MVTGERNEVVRRGPAGRENRLGRHPRIPSTAADSIRGYFRSLPAGGSARAGRFGREDDRVLIRLRPRAFSI